MTHIRGSGRGRSHAIHGSARVTQCQECTTAQLQPELGPDVARVLRGDASLAY